MEIWDRPVWALEAFLNRGEEFFSLFFFGDLGLGSLFGGFGLIFWGLCVPATIFLFFSAMTHTPFGSALGFRVNLENGEEKIGRDWFSLFLWGQMVLALSALFLYANSTELLLRSGRLVIFVAGLGLLGFGAVWVALFKDIKWSGMVFKGLCIGSSILTLILLGEFRDPQYDLREPLKDRLAGFSPSPYKYFYLGRVLEPLDDLSRGNKGLSVYVAGPKDFFWTAPFYGTKLQNRIWNFQPHLSSDPDAFIFHQIEEQQDLLYVGPRITPREVNSDPRYILIAQDQQSLFFLRKSLIEDSFRKKALIRFYKTLFTETLPLARHLSSFLKEGAVILTSSPIAYNLKYLELTGEISQRVFFAPVGTEPQVAQRISDDVIYTIGSPLAGYEFDRLMALGDEGNPLPVYKNIRRVHG